MKDINEIGPTLRVLQGLSVLAAVVHAEHKCIQNECHNDGHHHLDKEQTIRHLSQASEHNSSEDTLAAQPSPW